MGCKGLRLIAGTCEQELAGRVEIGLTSVFSPAGHCAWETNQSRAFWIRMNRWPGCKELECEAAYSSQALTLIPFRAPRKKGLGPPDYLPHCDLRSQSAPCLTDNPMNTVSVIVDGAHSAHHIISVGQARFMKQG